MSADEESIDTRRDCAFCGLPVEKVGGHWRHGDGGLLCAPGFRTRTKPAEAHEKEI